MFRPMNYYKLDLEQGQWLTEEPFKEPCWDLFDLVEQAESEGNRGGKAGASYVLPDREITPYTKAQLDAIDVEEKYSCFDKKLIYECRYCGERLKPWLDGRDKFCSDICAKEQSRHDRRWKHKLKKWRLEEKARELNERREMFLQENIYKWERT